MEINEHSDESQKSVHFPENIDKEVSEVNVGLSKSCLNQVLKEILSKNKVRGDKNIIPMLDSISRYYVTYLSTLGSKICLQSGKKTLNIDHVLEALKKMSFKNHIDLLVKDLPKGEKDPEKLKLLSNVKLTEDNEKDENNNLKKLINKKKKRGSRKKNAFMDENEKEKIKKQQDEMYEEALHHLSLQQQNQYSSDFKLGENSNDFGNMNNNENEISHEFKDTSNLNKEQKLDEYGKDIVFNKNEENDINFD